jgi:predicted P-loop ATPase
LVTPEVMVATIGLVHRSADASPKDLHALLRKDTTGLIRDEENVRLVLANDPFLTGIVRFNEFSGEMTLQRPIPGETEVVAERDTPRRWTDADTVALTTYLQRTSLPKIARDKVEATVSFFARDRCSYHPLRDYLQSLTWDGTPRVTNWLINYVGAVDAPAEYLEAVGQAFLVSAVARVFEPGCQVDCALVLEGPQGIGKSTALRVLASDDWFSDSLPSDLRHKDARDHLRGKWIVELPELAQFKRNEIETVKAFLSRRQEQFRPSYGRHEITYPRQCVFAGSTNEAEYLVDTTGNRRFWCVKCTNVDLGPLARDRDQLWAEAGHLYRSGATWHLTNELARLAAQEALGRVTLDPWTHLVADVLAGLPADQPDVSPGEVLDRLDLNTDQKHARQAARVGSILRDLGWHRAKRHSKRGQLFRRPSA